VADPVYALIFIGLALALLVATLIPAPQYPTEEEAGLGLTLLATGCVAALAMGVLALTALPVASAVLGAIAWLVAMPCIWLARAPRPADDWGGEEDDDDGGSPSPDMPSAPPAPDDCLPGLPPAAARAARVTWTPAPQPAPVMATAARVRALLDEQEAARLRAQQETERLLAARELDRVLATATPQPAAPAPLAATPPAMPGTPLHKPAPPRLRPAPRVRAEHPSAAPVPAAAAHARARRRAAADQPARRSASHR